MGREPHTTSDVVRELSSFAIITGILFLLRIMLILMCSCVSASDGKGRVFLDIFNCCCFLK